MPSRRRVLAAVSGALAPLAGCTAPLGSIPAIEDQPCPPVDRPTDRQVCSHTDAGGGIDLTVSPVTVTREPEALEDVRIELRNDTDEPIRHDPGQWVLYRTTGYGWREREPDVLDGETEMIQPGGGHVYAGLDAMFDLGPDGPTPLGLYAAITTVGVGGDDSGSTRSAGDPVDCIFLFRVVRSDG